MSFGCGQYKVYFTSIYQESRIRINIFFKTFSSETSYYICDLVILSMHFRNSFLAFFFLLLSVHTFVQAQSTALTNYTVQDGLPSNDVYDVLQDRQGFMWFATEFGAARFDGGHFECFTIQDGLPDNTVYKLFEDSKERIWFVPLNGLPVYFKDGKIHHVHAPANFTPSAAVVQSVSERDGMVVFALGQDFLTVDAKDILMDIKPIIYNQQEFRKAIGFDPADRSFWTLVKNKQDNQYSVEVLSDGKIKRFSSALFDSLIINAQYFSRASLLDCYKLDRGQPVIRDHRRLQFLQKALQFSKEWDFRFIIDNTESYWLSNGSKGFFTFSKSDCSITPYAGFSNWVVSACYLDKEGNNWFSTIGKGVFMKSSLHFKSRLLQRELPDLEVTAMHGNADSLWLGFKNGKAALYLIGEGKLHAFNYNNDLTITAIQTYMGRMIFGFNRGLAQINQGSLKLIQDKTRFINTPAIKCMSLMPNGKLLVGAHVGLLEVDSSFTIKDFLEPSTKIQSRCVSIASIEGATFVGTGKGLRRFVDGKLLLSGFRCDRVNQQIQGIVGLPNHWLALATKGEGVYLVKNQSLFQISKKEGLVGNNCTAILLDPADSSVLWVSTNEGLSRLQLNDIGRNQYSIDNITELEGLPAKEVRGVYVRQDSVYIATTSGLCIMAKKLEKQPKLDVPVFITGVSIDGVDTNWSHVLTLLPEQNSINITFVGLSYRSHGQVLYKYRMLGLDTAWSYTSYNSIAFPVLPQGKEYVFEVFAKGADDGWSKKPARVAFSIALPMMQSLWFRVLLVALFILGLFLFLRARLKLIRIQEHEKTSLNKKIAEMEMKALRAQMNPHFTFNALNSIQHLIMQQELGAAQKYLAQFSKLLRSVLENSRLTTITLDEELKAIHIYLSLEGLRFGNAFEYQLTLDPALIPAEIKIPSMMIQPFLENAIWHGLILKEGQRLLKLNILLEGEYLICSIEDNGIGREAASRGNSWKEGYRSMGMEVTKERLQLLNSTSDKVASFQIYDLHDELGVASGTRIELKIPYQEEFN